MPTTISLLLFRTRALGRVLLLAVCLIAFASCGSASSPPGDQPPDPSDPPPPIESPTPDEPPDSNEPPVPGGSVTPGDAEPPEPVMRTGRIDYPKSIQTHKPANVRFALFVSGSEPLKDPDTLESRRPLSVPDRPGLSPFVQVDLDVPGATVVAGPNASLQPLYATENRWEWQIVVQEEKPVVLRPVIHVEYRDPNGQVQDRVDIAWGETYTISEVHGENPVITAWSFMSEGIMPFLSTTVGLLSSIVTLALSRKTVQT